MILKVSREVSDNTVLTIYTFSLFIVMHLFVTIGFELYKNGVIQYVIWLDSSQEHINSFNFGS